MKKLQLSLFKEHFDKTKARIKLEDYRTLNAYWAARLILVEGKQQTKRWWDARFWNLDQFIELIKSSINNGGMKFKYFDINRMTLGYPKSTDEDRILELEHKGIEIREGNPDLGAEEGVLYFVILHGEIL